MVEDANTENIEDAQEAQVIDEPYQNGLWTFYPPKTDHFMVIEAAWCLQYHGRMIWRILLILVQFFVLTPIFLVINIAGIILYYTALLIWDILKRVWNILWTVIEKLLSQILAPLGTFLKVLAFMAGLFIAIFAIGYFDLWEALINQFD